MSSRDFDPQRLDVAAFAKAGGRLDGRWPLGRFTRLMESVVRDALPPGGGDVVWNARGEARPARGGAPEVRLHLGASTIVPLECQRCLAPVEVPLAIESSLLFVHGEDAAAQLDLESEEDVLALTRALDLQELVEDELLLALPLVPRHDVCPAPLPAAVEPDQSGDDEPHPFAALAALKRPRPLN